MVKADAQEAVQLMWEVAKLVKNEGMGPFAARTALAKHEPAKTSKSKSCASSASKSKSCASSMTTPTSTSLVTAMGIDDMEDWMLSEAAF